MGAVSMRVYDQDACMGSEALRFCCGHGYCLRRGYGVMRVDGLRCHFVERRQGNKPFLSQEKWSIAPPQQSSLHLSMIERT